MMWQRYIDLKSNQDIEGGIMPYMMRPICQEEDVALVKAPAFYDDYADGKPIEIGDMLLKGAEGSIFAVSKDYFNERFRELSPYREGGLQLIADFHDDDVKCRRVIKALEVENTGCVVFESLLDSNNSLLHSNSFFIPATRLRKINGDYKYKIISSTGANVDGQSSYLDSCFISS